MRKTRRLSNEFKRQVMQAVGNCAQVAFAPLAYKNLSRLRSLLDRGSYISDSQRLEFELILLKLFGGMVVAVPPVVGPVEESDTYIPNELSTACETLLNLGGLAYWSEASERCRYFTEGGSFEEVAREAGFNDVALAAHIVLKNFTFMVTPMVIGGEFGYLARFTEFSLHSELEKTFAFMA